MAALAELLETTLLGARIYLLDYKLSERSQQISKSYYDTEHIL